MDFEFDPRRRRAGGAKEVPWDQILVYTPIVLVLAAVVHLAANSFYTVEAHEKAIVLRFGKYMPPEVDSGLHFRIPLVDEVLKVSVEERSVRLPFGFGPDRPSGVPEEAALMLTGDLNATVVEWTIQWRVNDPYEYLVRFHRTGDEQYPERVISTVANTVMNRLVGDYSIDEILTGKRAELAERAREATQQILDDYQFGVEIRDLQMQRVVPPAQVRAAFDDVNASIQRRDKLENEAIAERNRLRPQALAEKDKMIKEAEGYAARRRAEATGEIEALLAKYREYEKAPVETRQRLYLEAMEEVLGAVESKVIVDSDVLGHTLPLLPLDRGVTP